MPFATDSENTKSTSIASISEDEPFGLSMMCSRNLIKCITLWKVSFHLFIGERQGKSSNRWQKTGKASLSSVSMAPALWALMAKMVITMNTCYDIKYKTRGKQKMFRH